MWGITPKVSWVLVGLNGRQEGDLFDGVKMDVVI